MTFDELRTSYNTQEPKGKYKGGHRFVRISIQQRAKIGLASSLDL